MPPIVSDDYKLKKRQEILASALVCFAKKGYQQATMDDIVEQSGVSKGAIYNYFSSKDEIYREVINQDTLILDRIVKDELQTQGSAADKISFLFDTYLSNNHKESPLKELFQVFYELRLQSCRDEKIAEFLKQRREHSFVNLVKSIVVDGQQRGEIKAGLDAEILAHTYWGMIDGASICVVTDPDYPYKEALTQMKNMFLAYLTPE
ncbi:TetR/AcrR family transcriptional regulator [Paenibacillus caui]|uniref:TetR/AcrR family transcriptional regulator n=1 Tax=Paenibacillus caui TaxID=2873927 RepID=UPI001CA8B0D7|nr:TetR/AcrR family transcriptional regulator [Paenibacillus caui]